MEFRTKLDYSDNRQIKQRERTETTLSGTTIFGVPFSGLTSGPNLSLTAQTSQYFNVISSYSGNSATTIFTWGLPNVSIIEPYISALTSSNSGVSQNINAIFASSSSTIIDGNTVNLTYSGISVENLYAITMVELTPGNYTGTVSTDFFVYSAQSLDFTGRTIWIDNTEILRTKKLIVSDNPQVGYVLTSDSQGMATWQSISAVTSGTTFWSASTGTNGIVLEYSDSIASGLLSIGEGYQTTASGDYSHAEGQSTTASGNSSHAEGIGTTAQGFYSHGEGFYTRAIGNQAHSEGSETYAIGNSSHSEGNQTTASGLRSHAEGWITTSIGTSSHAEGYQTTSSGNSSHSEGRQTKALGDYSHAEGVSTIAYNQAAHAEGSYTTAVDAYSHAEGSSTIASGASSHAEGDTTKAIGQTSHSEGGQTTAFGNGSHAEGLLTTSKGNYSHAEGLSTIASGTSSHSEGSSTKASGVSSHAEGDSTTAIGNQSHAEGNLTTATGFASHSEGLSTTASGQTSHSEGYYTTAVDGSHSEGNTTKALGIYSHAEGTNTFATGQYSHAEGFQTTASGNSSHAEGFLSKAIGQYSHAENSSIASGDSSHAEGGLTTAKGTFSHSQNNATRAVGQSSHAGGYDTTSQGDYSFIHSFSSTVTGDRSAVIGGSGITGSANDTVYVPDLVIDGLTSQDPIATDANGKIVAGTSDIRLKQNVNSLTNALDVIKNLRGVSFEYTEESNMGSGIRFGFIAQEVQEIVPDMVRLRAKGDGMLNLNYTEVIPWLVEAIKDLTKTNTTLNELILETETIAAEDNNIELNYNGNKLSAIGGGISIINGIDDGINAEFKLNIEGSWVTNNSLAPSSLIIPEYTPTSSYDIYGKNGDITRDENYLYIKDNNSWKRLALQTF
jgi:hypothetical protein